MLAALLLNWSKSCCIEFFWSSFLLVLNLLNIILDEYSLFLSHVKSVFFNDDREWSASFLEYNKWIISSEIYFIYSKFCEASLCPLNCLNCLFAPLTAFNCPYFAPLIVWRLYGTFKVGLSLPKKFWCFALLKAL